MVLKDNKLYYVGGYVRDKILGIKNIDVDYCYEGDAIKFAQNLNILRTNPKFGTVKVLFDGQEIDIASTRTETYPKKGHLPVVSNIGCSLEEDLKRRDFTINAMAIKTATEKLFDPYNGQNDISNKQLRILHSNSFIDDPTRIIRGLKFAVRFGFELELGTLELQREYLDNVNYDMSYHRLKKELVDAFSILNPKILKDFIEYKMYNLLSENQTMPDINIDKLYEFVNEYPSKNSWLIILSLFDLSKLPLTKQESKILEWAEKLKTQKETNNTPFESILIRRCFDNV